MLVTRREAEPLLGYAPGSLKAVMQQQRSRWPAPVACQARHPRALLWDLDELTAAAARGDWHGSRRPSGADDDGLLTCLECGRRFRSLGPHLGRGHGITAEEYREQHRLPVSTALMATDVRTSLSETRREAMQDDPELVARMRAATPALEEMARRATEARAGTNELPAVRAARRAAREAQQFLSVAARAQTREETARSAGYSSWTAAVEGTAHLSDRKAAEVLGVGKTTIRRWRGRLTK